MLVGTCRHPRVGVGGAPSQPACGHILSLCFLYNEGRSHAGLTHFAGGGEADTLAGSTALGPAS